MRDLWRLWHEHPVLVSLTMFAGFALAVLGMLLLGLRLGRRPVPSDATPTPGVSAVEGAVFGLFGLLIAFAFAGAAERFHTRKALILQQTQALGTAWSRVDLLPPGPEAQVRDQMRAYLDRTLASYAAKDLGVFEEGLLEAERQGDVMVQVVAAACQDPTTSEFAEVLMPAFNAALDVAVARRAAVHNHPPLAIYGLLVALAMLVGLMIGLGMAPGPRRSWVHILCFCVVVSATLCVTIDLELPRAGWIRVDAADALLYQLRDSWR